MREKSDKSGGGLRFMVAAAFFFSVMSLLVKLAGRRLPTSEIVLIRSVVMLIVSYVLVRRARIAPWGTRRALLIFRGLAGFSALFCFFYAVTKLPLADVTVIHYTNPVFTALLAAAVLRETMRGREIVGILLSIFGVILVARPSFLFGRYAGDLDAFAVSLAALASVLSACAYVAIRKLRETEHYLVIIFYFSLVATVASVPIAAGQFTWPTPAEWVLLLGIGVITQTAQVFLTKGLSRERAGRAMSIGFIQVVFAAGWGVLFFGDYPGAASLAGAALIFSGLLVVAGRLR